MIPSEPKQQDLTQKDDSLWKCLPTSHPKPNRKFKTQQQDPALLSRSGLAVWSLKWWLGFGLLVEGHSHNEPSTVRVIMISIAIAIGAFILIILIIIVLTKSIAIVRSKSWVQDPSNPNSNTWLFFLGKVLLFGFWNVMMVGFWPTCWRTFS